MARSTLHVWKNDGSVPNPKLEPIWRALEKTSARKYLSLNQCRFLCELFLGVFDPLRRRSEEHAIHLRRAARLRRRGPGQLQRLRGRLKKASESILDAQRQLDSICGDDDTPSGNPYLAAALEERGLPERIATATRALSQIEQLTDSVLSIPEDPGPEMLPTKLSLRLVLFYTLHFEFRLGMNATSQLIAEIENAHWGGSVSARDEHSHTPNRSAAIQNFLKRHVIFKPRQ